MSHRKTVLRGFGFVVLRVMIPLVRLLPLRAGLALGRGIGIMTRYVSPKRYQVALTNLRIAFGDSLSEEERKRIARESFRQWGMFPFEVMKFAYMSDEEALRRTRLCDEDIILLREVLKKGKGSLLISAHLGNMDAGGRGLIVRGFPMTVLAREARDSGTTRIMTELRERIGYKVARLGRSLRPVFHALRRNELVGVVCDQNATDVFVPFFGRPTGTVDGPARIALKTGAPMVFCSFVRERNGIGALKFYGRYDAEPTGDLDADICRVMTEVNRRLEQMIRDHPEQWLWFHNRWKSSPNVRDPME